MSSIPAHAAIKNLGVIGRTYPISESDALQEIRTKASGIDWKKVIQSTANLERLKNYKPKGIHNLPRAIQDRTFLVDMTYTLDFDIPNGKGGILYPAGYTCSRSRHGDGRRVSHERKHLWLLSMKDWTGGLNTPIAPH